jgi:zinc protease
MVQRWERDPPPASLPPRARRDAAPTSFVLKNGIKLIVVESHRRPTVSVQLYLAEGAASDPSQRAGATAMALQLLGDTFDEKNQYGSDADPLEKSARRQTAELGAQLYFSVNDDTSLIGVDGFAPDVGLYLARIVQVIKEARHGSDSFASRMDTAVAELNDRDLSDNAVLAEHLGRLTFGDHPYGRPVWGTPQSIGALTLNEVIERQEELLTPRGATLLVVGDVSAQKVFKLAQGTLGGWAAEGAHKAPAISAPPVTRRQFVTVLPRVPARTTIMCGGRALSDVTATTQQLQLLTAVLNDRLSNVVREQLNIAYSVEAFMLRRRKARSLIACAQVRSSRTTDGLTALVKELDRSATTPPTPDELDRARKGLVASYQASLDDSRSIVASWHRSITLQQPVAIADAVSGLQQATAEDIGALAAKVLKPDLFQWVLSGDPASISAAVAVNKLGKTKTPQLEKIVDDEPVVDDMP